MINISRMTANDTGRSGIEDVIHSWLSQFTPPADSAKINYPLLSPMLQKAEWFVNICTVLNCMWVCSTAWSTLALAATWTYSMWTIDINESCPSELNDRTMNVSRLVKSQAFFSQLWFSLRVSSQGCDVCLWVGVFVVNTESNLMKENDYKGHIRLHIDGVLM